MTTSRIAIAATTAAFFGWASAAAQDGGWSGEANFSANANTGNTESTDIGVGVKLARELGRWTHAGGVQYDYGEADEVETKNRFFGEYQLDYQLTDRAYTFGRGSYEVDEFSGYDSRIFLGAGLGYDVIQRDTVTWSLQAAPGFRIDEIRQVLDTDAVTVLVPEETQESFAVNFGSRYSNQLNDAVTLSNDSDVTWSDESTILFNNLALTAQLMSSLSARFGVEVTHDTDPPIGSEETDTTTRAALVYTLGE